MFRARVRRTGVAHGIGSLDGSAVHALEMSSFVMDFCASLMHVHHSWVSRNRWTRKLKARDTLSMYMLITCSGRNALPQCLKALFFHRESCFSSSSGFYLVSQKSCTAFVIFLACAKLISK